ncbi:MAG: PEP-CTERM sorting domain-containing protein [Aquabacterium sp.]|nr:PEP-CTERM sorting domain-containing protein [Aquabacterium sp.]
MSPTLISLAVCMVAATAHAAPVIQTPGTPFEMNGAWYTYQGTSTLTYSATKVGNDGLGGIVNTVIAPATYNTVTHANTAAITEMVVDQAAGTLIAKTMGGMHQEAVRNGLMTGGFLDVSNLYFDSTKNQLIADVHGVGKVAGDQGYKSMAFFDVRSTQGLVASIPGAGTYKATLSGLYLTNGAMDYITKSLGLGGLAASITKGTDFGVVTSSFTVSKALAPAVPEASTYAMMGLGLFGLAFMRRQRKA